MNLKYQPPAIVKPKPAKIAPPKVVPAKIVAIMSDDESIASEVAPQFSEDVISVEEPVVTGVGLP